MKGIGIGPAGGRALSRMQGTKVTLAGRTAFLPNDDVPFVMQKLTMGQINAIPRDRFAVSVVGVPTRMAMAGSGKKGRGGMALKGLQRMKNLTRPSGGVTGFVRVPSDIISIEEDGTKQYTAMVTLIDQIKLKTESLYDTALRLSRNQRSNPPEKDSGLFYSPIDDGSMTLDHGVGSTDHFSALKIWMFENKFVSLPSHLKTIEPMEVHRESRTMCNTETSKVISSARACSLCHAKNRPHDSFFEVGSVGTEADGCPLSTRESL